MMKRLLTTVLLAWTGILLSAAPVEESLGHGKHRRPVRQDGDDLFREPVETEAAETEKAVLPEPATIPSGNSFIGWYIGENKVGDAGDEYTMGTADVELTAKFSAPAETPAEQAE